ncbi:MAG: helix-turn-helix domain-containing protein [Desulfovibrionaceae bacterium]
MHAEQALTHQDLASGTGVSVTTIKSYRRKFPGFIPVAGFGKPIRFRPEALAACRFIRERFELGSGVREVRGALEEAGFAQDRKSIPPPDPGAGLADGRMEEFLRSAGEMMRSVALLAEAQRNTDERLARLEEGLARLATMEAENKALLARLGPLAGSFADAGDVSPREDAEAASAPAPEEPAAPRLRAKKIVNVRAADGRVDSYALEDEDGARRSMSEPPSSPPPAAASEPPSSSPSPASGGEPTEPAVAEPAVSRSAVSRSADPPPPDLLDRPAAIRSEEGEYLGLPGKLTLRELAAFLLDRGLAQGNMDAAWTRDGNGWRYHLHYADGRARALTFMSQTTPTGVKLALLTRLVLDGIEASPEKRLDYFRRIKDLKQRS